MTTSTPLPLVEEGTSAPVTRPGETPADPLRGFVTGLAALLNQRDTPPVEEGAPAPVTGPGETRAYPLRGFVTGLAALLNQRGAGALR